MLAFPGSWQPNSICYELHSWQSCLPLIQLPRFSIQQAWIEPGHDGSERPPAPAPVCANRPFQFSNLNEMALNSGDRVSSSCSELPNNNKKQQANNNKSISSKPTKRSTSIMSLERRRMLELKSNSARCFCLSLPFNLNQEETMALAPCVFLLSLCSPFAIVTKEVTFCR